MMALFDPAKNRGMTAQASLVTAVTLRRIIRSISLYGDKRPRPDEPIGARYFFHLSPSQLFPGRQVLNGLGSRAHLLQPFQHHAQRSISPAPSILAVAWPSQTPNCAPSDRVCPPHARALEPFRYG